MPILVAEPVGFEPGVVCLCLEVLDGLDCCLVLKLDVLESSGCRGYSGLEEHYSFVVRLWESVS